MAPFPATNKRSAIEYAEPREREMPRKFSRGIDMNIPKANLKMKTENRKR
jgi:hypothetical protein